MREGEESVLLRCKVTMANLSKSLKVEGKDGNSQGIYRAESVSNNGNVKNGQDDKPSKISRLTHTQAHSEYTHPHTNS